ncbi:SRPBCC family protein [Pseudonocardia sp. DSM 110487]|uniref:SRPBCC family protein n=1 Tax=Pseudonocardia sp. DSM 110487 TaxID=2865833 RepID=UPI001C6A1F0A|nr:SRPBCC family protein [Pseudonocardia sp. DSM 110487]QYN36748.1 SRPBCC family protein [Pseudonocardia sp. DSM 110487]
MTRVEVGEAVEVGAPAEVVWHTVTDWASQGEWMLGTRVRPTSGGDGRRLGAILEAVTGFGPLGVTDRMEIVEWSPPRRCVVRHLGRVVRGDGVFEVLPLGPERARFRWSELLDLPLGRLGALGWAVVRPAFRAGLVFSLRRLERRCEAVYRSGA